MPSKTSAAKSKNSSTSSPARKRAARGSRQMRQGDQFLFIDIKGRLLPVGLLGRTLSPERLTKSKGRGSGLLTLDGLEAKYYELLPGERISDRVTEDFRRLLNAWELFSQQIDQLPKEETGEDLTLRQWLLPLLTRILGFRVEAKPIPVIGKNYAISHRAHVLEGEGPVVPMLLCSFRQDIGDDRDKRSSLNKRPSPQSILQGYLNQAPDPDGPKRTLWGIVSNGFHLRILRENPSLAQPAYVDFDLKSIMETQNYSEFTLFWYLAHATRFKPREDTVKNDKDKGSSQNDSGAGDSNEEEESEPSELKTTTCFLEKYRDTAREEEVRAFDTLCTGVQRAIVTLGRGFQDPRQKNTQLCQTLKNGKGALEDYYHQLLRLVYRMVFLFIAEDRGLLFSDDVPRGTRDIYNNYYSMRRLRHLAEETLRGYRGGNRNGDLWILLRENFQRFIEGNDRLGLPAFGSALFGESSDERPSRVSLDNVSLDNGTLLAAIRDLTFTRINKSRQPISYEQLGTEELGSIYEALLEMHPVGAYGNFSLEAPLSGNDRKTSGSYYTPPELVRSLVESTVVPVMEKRLSEARSIKDKEKAILSMKVCDPTCGSGHFLIGAARRMGHRLAEIRAGEISPSPRKYSQAVRDVIAHCLYGADINPMSVELCKVALWIESMAPGTALMFLDHRIRCGNTYMGTTRELVKRGIPQVVFTDKEWENKELRKDLRKKNEDDLKGINRFDFERVPDEEQTGALLAAIDDQENKSANDYKQKQKLFRDYCFDPARLREKACFDLWCAAFVWPTRQECEHPTTADLAVIKKKGMFDMTDTPRAITQRETLEKLVKEYQFFHWELEFPDVFTPERNGFDVVIGNPPWERIKLQEKEWFAKRNDEVATALNKSVRAELIQKLKKEDKELYALYERDLRKHKLMSFFVHKSGCFPNCKGDVNTYAVFAEGNLKLINPRGRVGCVIPSGIATDDSTRGLFTRLMNTQTLVSLHDFENRKKLFPAVDSRMKFSLLTVRGPNQSNDPARFSFFNLAVSDLEEEGHSFTLTLDDTALVNPNTRTVPICRSIRDFELTKAIYRRVPILLREGAGGSEEENPWGVRFSTQFHMSNDSDKFHTYAQLEGLPGEWDRNRYSVTSGDKTTVYLPLYEGKMIHQFNHRFNSFEKSTSKKKQTPFKEFTLEQLSDPKAVAMPRYWVEEKVVEEKLRAFYQRNGLREQKYFLGFRNITNVTNERTCISTVAPVSAINGHLALVFMGEDIGDKDRAVYLACENSFCHDYCARQKIGGTDLSFSVYKQIPHLPPDRLRPYADEIVPKVLELVYTADEMRPFAESLGYRGEPFRWDPKRRFDLRCQLDALFFGLYLGFNRWSEAVVAEEKADDFRRLIGFFPDPLDALDHIMGTFPIVKDKEAPEKKEENEPDTEEIVWARELLGAGGGERYDPKQYYPSHAVIRKYYLDYREEYKNL